MTIYKPITCLAK